MKLFVLSMLILFSGRSFSQVDLSYPPGRWQEKEKTALWIDSLKSVFHPKTLIVDGKIADPKKGAAIIDPGVYPARMPTRRIENKGIYQYNNRRGFDIYSMNIDNMPCLVPDSTFQSHLPGAESSKKKRILKRP